MDGAVLRWRIRSVFLEKYLVILRQREVSSAFLPIDSSHEQPLALMLDWENVKISLSKYIDKMPVARARELSAA